MSSKTIFRSWMLVSTPADRRLLLPEDFYKRCLSDIPRKGTLITGDEVEWEIEYEKEGGAVYICVGWSKFRDELGVGLLDMLLFKYTKPLLLRVKIYKAEGGGEHHVNNVAKLKRRAGGQPGVEIVSCSSLSTCSIPDWKTDDKIEIGSGVGDKAGGSNHVSHCCVAVSEKNLSGRQNLDLPLPFTRSCLNHGSSEIIWEIEGAGSWVVTCNRGAEVATASRGVVAFLQANDVKAGDTLVLIEDDLFESVWAVNLMKKPVTG